MILRILYRDCCLKNLLYVLALLQGISHRKKKLDKTKSCSEYLNNWNLFTKWKEQKPADFPQKECNALVCSNAVAHPSEVILPPQMMKRLISTRKSKILLKLLSNVVHIFSQLFVFNNLISNYFQTIPAVTSWIRVSKWHFCIVFNGSKDGCVAG